MIAAEVGDGCPAGAASIPSVGDLDSGPAFHVGLPPGLLHITASA